jgi:hypothetical protein
MATATCGVFLCERWRFVDLDTSMAIVHSLRTMSVVGFRLDVWIGTEKDTTAAGMSEGIRDAALFVLVLRDGTLQGRGVQHEVATALRAGKPAIVFMDLGDGLSLGALLAQAALPAGDPVVGYEVLSPAELQAIAAWATAYSPPIGFRRDSTFETDALPEFISTTVALLLSLLPAPAALGAAADVNVVRNGSHFRLCRSPRPPPGV